MNKKFTIGTDPEFFILHCDSGKPLKSSEYTGGTKDDLEDLGDGYLVHADNVMLELNIPAAIDKERFVSNVNTGKLKLKGIIGDHILKISPSMDFDKAMLTEELDWEVGCDPDMSAYTQAFNEAVTYENTMRFAGGHVHVGIEEKDDDMDLIYNIVKALDVLFLDMVVREDKDQLRKEIYGTPGRFRVKPYGLEYRSLSNFWCSNEKYMRRVYDIVQEAVNNYPKYLNEFDEKRVMENFQTTQKTKVLQTQSV
jgi:hypothetical protein